MNSGLLRTLAKKVLNTKRVLAETTFKFKVKCPHSGAGGERCAQETVDKCMEILREEVTKIKYIESLIKEE